MEANSTTGSSATPLPNINPALERMALSVTLPPNGFRGVTMPRFVLPLMKAGMGLSHLVFRMLGDRMKIQGQQLLMLTTVGAKTGIRRHAILARFPDPTHPGTWLVIGSNGGSARHPSWCYNLAKNPEQAWIKMGKGPEGPPRFGQWGRARGSLEAGRISCPRIRPIRNDNRSGDSDHPPDPGHLGRTTTV